MQWQDMMFSWRPASRRSGHKNENSRAEQRTPTHSTHQGGTIMNELELRKEILDYEELFKAFEGLLKVRHKFFVSYDHLATALCELYAIMGAYQILACMGTTGQFEVAATRE